MNTRKIGTAGETLAEKYLKKQGYKILQKNFVAPHGEIDIVAKDGDYIVFVEVKRRKSTAFGLPCEAVDARKQPHDSAVRQVLPCQKQPVRGQSAFRRGGHIAGRRFSHQGRFPCLKRSAVPIFNVSQNNMSDIIQFMTDIICVF